MAEQKKWGVYFNVKGLKNPGKVQNPKTGVVDLSKENLPVAKVKALYDAGCPYLELTADGKKELYPETKETAPVKK